jgi:hypothetical protein
MSLLETYCVTGFLFTMFFEYLFETNQDSEMKFTGLTERVVFFTLWPLILFIVIKESLKNIDIF